MASAFPKQWWLRDHVQQSCECTRPRRTCCRARLCRWLVLVVVGTVWATTVHGTNGLSIATNATTTRRSITTGFFAALSAPQSQNGSGGLSASNSTFSEQANGLASHESVTRPNQPGSGSSSSFSPSEWTLEANDTSSIHLLPPKQPSAPQRLNVESPWPSTIATITIRNETPISSVLNNSTALTISVHLASDKVENLEFAVLDPKEANVNLLLNESALALPNLTILTFSGVGVSFESTNWLNASDHLTYLAFNNCLIHQFEWNSKWSIDFLQVTNSTMFMLPAALLLGLNHKSLVMDNVTIETTTVLTDKERQDLNTSSFSFADIKQEATCSETTSMLLLNNTNFSVCVTNGSITEPPEPDSALRSQTPQHTEASSKSDSNMTTVAIVLGVMGGLVLVVGGFVLVRRRATSSKDTSDMTDADNQYSSLLGGTAVETRDKIPVMGDSGVLGELEIPQEEVVVGQKLGAHGLSLAQYLKSQVVMLKVLKDQSSKTAMQEFDRAVLSFVNLRHSNVINFIGLVRFDATEMGVLVEYMQKGSLRSLLANPQVVLSWKQRLHIAQDLCRGLTFVQSTKTARRVSPNLCAQRVFCDNEFNCKLNIFDYSMPLSDCITPLLSYGIGIMAYRAPEVLVSGQTSEQSQIYALGVIFYELSSRIQPYHDMMVERGWTMAEILISQRVASGELKPEISGDAPEAFQDLTARCLSFASEDRPTLSEISTLLYEL